MKTILVPTDFSDNAFNAVKYAAQFAKEFNATLHLLNVFHVPAPLMALPVEIAVTDEEFITNGNKNFKSIIDNLSKTFSLNLKVVTEIRKGHTAQEIGDYANNIGADLIIMGMRGSGFLKEKVLGSTVTSLIKNTNNSLLIIPHNAGFRKVKKVSFASDGKNIAGVSDMKILFDICEKFHSEINVMNVNVPGHIQDQDKAINNLEGIFIGKKHSYFFPLIKDVNEGIEEFIVEKAADMLALIHRRHSLVEKLFWRSHSKKFAFHSHIPVLIIQDLNKEDETVKGNERVSNEINKLKF
jgi:nucleotide-binding universal stress UspA family protein